MSLASIEGLLHGGQRILPNQHFGRHFGAQIACHRTHVAVGELVPCAGEGIGKLIGIARENAWRFFRIRGQIAGQVRGEHRSAHAANWGRAHRAPSCTACHVSAPLLRTSGTFGQFPFVAEEMLEEVKLLLHLVWCFRPSTFEATRDRIDAFRRCGCVLCQPMSLLCNGGPAGAGPTYLLGSPAPWVLPKLCPPAIRATVSSSSIAMRPKVSRMSRAASRGSGLPFGPSGFT
jgi:hypothetical protein